MRGYSVECICGKWFINPQALKDHCKATGCWKPNWVGSCSKELKDNKTSK